MTRRQGVLFSDAPTIAWGSAVRFRTPPWGDNVRPPGTRGVIVRVYVIEDETVYDVFLHNGDEVRSALSEEIEEVI